MQQALDFLTAASEFLTAYGLPDEAQAAIFGAGCLASAAAARVGWAGTKLAASLSARAAALAASAALRVARGNSCPLAEQALGQLRGETVVEYTADGTSVVCTNCEVSLNADGTVRRLSTAAGKDVAGLLSRRASRRVAKAALAVVAADRARLDAERRERQEQERLAAAAALRDGTLPQKSTVLVDFPKFADLGSRKGARKS